MVNLKSDWFVTLGKSHCATGIRVRLSADAAVGRTCGVFFVLPLLYVVNRNYQRSASGVDLDRARDHIRFETSPPGVWEDASRPKVVAVGEGPSGGGRGMMRRFSRPFPDPGR